jgi:ribosomal protein L10
MELKTLSGQVIDLTTLQHDSIIIVRGVRDFHAQKNLVAELKAVVPVSASILVFGNQEHAGIELVPEAQMNELGWYRRKWKDRMTRLIHRAKKAIRV